MRRNFTDDSLEDFLKNNSDKFQMRPSDKVWKGIQDNLKRRRRRIGWFTGLFLVCTSAGVYFLAEQAGHNGALATATGATSNGSAELARQSAPASFPVAENGNPASNTSHSVTSGNSSTGNLTPNGTGLTMNADPISGETASSGAAANQLASRHRNSAREVNHISSPRNIRAGNTLRALTGNGQRNPGGKTIHSGLPGEMGAEIELSAGLGKMIDASLETPVEATRPNLLSAVTPSEEKPQAPKTGRERTSVQFFFTPTVSYRKLTENKDYKASVPQGSADPNAAALYNINDIVTHKPNIGIELGLTAKVPVSRVLKLQGGLQFNMSRYDVQVFDNAQPQPALIAYRGGGGQTSQTNYTNMEGTSAKKDWLQNMYFQVSAPIGIEVQLAGNENTQFGIASTIQPTYILSDRVYMLSTDYKSYAEVPWLIRRWNVNTALSTYIGYSTGKLNWQIGPQVRYQLLSSFVSKYPVRENLFDFGLRVGVSLNSSRR
jgi:hypothetical protein